MTKADQVKFEALEKRVAELENQLNEIIRNKSSKRAGEIDINTQIAEMGTKLTDLSSGLSEAATAARAAGEAVENLKEDVNNKFKTADENTKTLNTHLPQIATKLSKSINKLSSQNSFFNVGDVSGSISALGSLKTVG